MKGLIRRSVALACLVGGLAGCQSSLQERYNRCVDPCWPERYSAMAVGSVNHAFAAQVNNGHILDQTVWNHHFEPGTDKLTAGGQYQLSILGRRRPHPDPKLYLQTAQDIAFDPAAPEKFAQGRAELDAKRVQAVLRYVQTNTAARPVAWDVTVHDPGEVGMSAVPMAASILQRNGNFRGVLPNTVGGSSVGGGSGGGGQ
jgi:hypothetical protein